jgi:Holliday junction DNA helicase RuvA
MPTSAISSIGTPGKEIKVFTHTHVREDAITLYGFPTAEELWLFETLIGVTGLGPKLALALLSAMTTDQAIMAIASGNADLLDTVPGIGKKVASRIVLELKEKIGAGLAISPSSHVPEENADVLGALTSLGYSAAEAVKAVASLPTDAKLELEAKVKMALQYLGQR